MLSIVFQKPSVKSKILERYLNIILSAFSLSSIFSFFIITYLFDDNEKVENINLDCNTFLDKDITDDKVGILDIKAKFGNGVTCDIEMQVVEKNDMYKRLL